MTKYVLSLDGGGVRGLASANFLRKLEFEMHKPLLEKLIWFVVLLQEAS